MTTVVLIAIFLFAGWVCLVLCGFINVDVGLVFCAVIALTAVVIVASTIIIGKLDELIEKQKNNEKEEK